MLLDFVMIMVCGGYNRNIWNKDFLRRKWRIGRQFLVKPFFYLPYIYCFWSKMIANPLKIWGEGIKLHKERR